MVSVVFRPINEYPRAIRAEPEQSLFYLVSIHRTGVRGQALIAVPQVEDKGLIISIEYKLSFRSMRSRQRLNLKLNQMKKGRSKMTKKGNKRSRQNFRLGIDRCIMSKSAVAGIAFLHNR